MSTPVTLNTIATDVVGHYGNAAKSIVAACRTASKRALAASGSRYAKLVERTALPVVGDKGKARIVAAERRVAEIVGERVVRIADGYDRGIQFVSGQAVKGLETLAERTDWAKDMFVVDTLRRINLPAAKLSLKVASRLDELASALNARAKGTVARPAVKAAAKKARVVRRARRTA
jgi:predicted transcriptional regulator